MVLNRQEILDWKNNPVTKAFFDQLEDDRDRIANEVIEGAYTGATVDETAQLIAREIGRAQAIQNILEFSIEDLLEDAYEEVEDED